MVYLKEELLYIIGKIIRSEELFKKQINQLRDIADTLNEIMLDDSFDDLRESTFLGTANKECKGHNKPLTYYFVSQKSQQEYDRISTNREFILAPYLKNNNTSHRRVNP